MEMIVLTALYVLTILLPVHAVVAVRVIAERKRNKQILNYMWRFRK